MPACWCNAGDAAEGGATRTSNTLLLVMAVEGASSEGGKGVSLVRMAIFKVCIFFEVGGGVSRQNIRKMAKL
jgi:hypothetical protein